MSGKFEPDKFEDRYEQAMIALIRSKQGGQPAPCRVLACGATAWPRVWEIDRRISAGGL